MKLNIVFSEVFHVVHIGLWWVTKGGVVHLFNTNLISPESVK